MVPIVALALTRYFVCGPLQQIAFTCKMYLAAILTDGLPIPKFVVSNLDTHY